MEQEVLAREFVSQGKIVQLWVQAFRERGQCGHLGLTLGPK
jgi:hypothetical protein